MSTSSFYNTTGPDSSQVTAIEGSVSSAADSAAAAEAAKVAAQSSASQAAASSNANSTSAAASEASKVAAQVAENNAETAETNSAASAAAALVSKNASAASAVASEASKVTSVNSASTSTTKAAEASTSETNAAASAATATSKASDSETARAASVVAKDASVVAKNESVSARDASVAAKNASVAAQAAAETAETNTETAETNSASSASAASASAATASTKASEASTSAAASETSKVASEAAKDAALAALDSFDDRYLGSSANSPTVDNDGDALAAGMLYFNTTTDEMKVYDGSQWLNAYASLSGALLATGNLSDLNNAATARANLGLGTAATTPSTDYATAAQGTKVDGIEASADVTDTTNVTAAGALMDSEVTNLAQVKAFDSADYATAAQGTTADAALPRTGGAMTGAITTNSTFDGRDVATDGTKLDGIEAGATADQTDAEIRAAVEAATDSNVFTDADHSKLNAIEASADVTDTANVTAAGALMDSELTSEASVKALNQGVATTDSPTFAGLNASGDLTLDVAGNIILDADGGEVKLDDGGTRFANLYKSSNNFVVSSAISDGDILLKGNDGGSVITALTLDMSAAGAATFNSTVTSTGLTANVPTGNGLVINSADIGTIKMTLANGSQKNWGFATTNLAAGDFGLYQSNSNGGDPITAGTAKLYINASGNVLVGRTSSLSGQSGSVSANTVVSAHGGLSAHATSAGILEHHNDETILRSYGANAGSGKLVFKVGGGGGSADSEAMRINSSGQVSIGSSFASGVATRVLTVDDPSNAAIVVAHNGATALNLYADADEANIGSYLQGANMKFFTTPSGGSTTERIRIEGSSGNLLVGKTATSQTTAGTVLYSNGQIYATASGTQASVLTRLSSDGPIQIFYKDSSEVGRIGTQGGDLYLGTDDANIKFYNSASIQPVNSVGGVRDNAIDLGSSSARFKDLYLSGGVYLGGTGAANKLDDYESGTWTPFLDASSTDPSITYNTQVGAYEKIGALVHASFFINVQAVNSQGSGQLRIAGLPFNASSNVNANEVPAVLLQTEPFNAGDGAGYQQFARTQGNTNVLLMGYKTGTGGTSIPSGANDVGTGYLIGHIVYRTLS